MCRNGHMEGSQRGQAVGHVEGSQRGHVVVKDSSAVGCKLKARHKDEGRERHVGESSSGNDSLS